MTGSSPPHAPSRRLAPRPQSAGEARRFVESALVGVDGDVLDTVQLLTSELVTNAVLHAGTELEIRVWASGGRVHVSVYDEAPGGVVSRREDDIDAATGRGLQMVEILASAYGTEFSQGGKTVWFELWPGPPDAAPSVWRASEAASSDLVATVTLHDVPVGLCRATQRHRRALLREGRLALRRDEVGARVTAEELTLATGLSDRVDLGLDACLAELGEDQATFDCSLLLPADCQPAADTLASVLDALDSAARDGVLLTRPALPEIRRFREWMIEQIVSQVDTPATGAYWSAQVDTYDGPGPADPEVEWELGSDTADVATVAANDDNRIVAISAAAGRLLGWTPDELRGRRLTEVIPESWRDRHVSGFTEFLLTGRSRIIGKPLQLPVLHRDGSVVEVNLVVTVEQSLQGRTVFVARLTPTT